LASFSAKVSRYGGPVEDEEQRANSIRVAVKRSYKEEEGVRSGHVAVDRDERVMLADSLNFTAGKSKGDRNGEVRVSQ
jgi:hypothetical protein